MAVCKHCGTEIEDRVEYCPNCGQSIDENFGEFFDVDEELEEEAYNIFDEPEEFDMDSLLSREFSAGITTSRSESEQPESTVYEEPDEPEEVPLFDLFGVPDETESDMTEPDIAEQDMAEQDMAEQDMAEPEVKEQEFVQPEVSMTEVDDISELLGLFSEETDRQVEELPSEPEEDDLKLPEAEETDFFALDELFEELDPSSVENVFTEEDTIDHGLEELLAASDAAEEPKKKNKKDKKKEKSSFFKKVFGNVPIDPSKVKPEPTPEQIAAKKQKEAEEKKAKAEEKKLAAEEKKQIAQRNKEEKDRQKALAKEEKKARKLEEAKQILEEMKDTRINRVGATIVFIFFAICAFVILTGSEIFGYTISIKSAETNFNKAYNNNVKYYTDAYNDIYGLEIKPEDQVLSEKIMTVMFVNKELNSYNSHMVMEDYHSALHSLLLGLYRYGKYYEKAVPLGIDRDMDYVRTQILKELDAKFDVSEDEAELLRSMLEMAGAGGMNTSIDADAARIYNLALYEILKESGRKNDSNN